MSTEEYINNLTAAFKAKADPVNAAGQEAYMRNKFSFIGLKAPIRKEIQRPFLTKANLPPKDQLPDLIKALWEKEEREFQMFGQELYFKYARSYEEDDINLMEFMVAYRSWWDSVDFIAAKCMGAYFQKFPGHRNAITDRWLESGNMWLQRSAVLFQLKYKDKTDTDLLSSIIHRLLGSKEFFINKAIGWILREYSKTNPQWVKEFVNTTELEPLSRKEAIRLLDKP